MEDLAALLAYVKQQHPDVTAVASGAIASGAAAAGHAATAVRALAVGPRQPTRCSLASLPCNPPPPADYQRTRVERVCARLGLVSLAYLWHQPQAALLRRMIDGRIDAILVKVAAAGLTPAKHLGAHLATLPVQVRSAGCCGGGVASACSWGRVALPQRPCHQHIGLSLPTRPRPQLHALRRLYGSNVCGEGGEYESLTLDCPLFTHGRIVLDAWEAVSVSEDSMAPVALLHPTAFHVEPRGPALDSGSGDARVVEVPADWRPEPAPMQQAAAAAEAADTALDVRVAVAGGSLYCSLTASVAATGTSDLTSAAGTAAALAAALRAVTDALPGLGLGWRASLFVHLYVPSMAQFGAANAAYAACLPAINPPARATVQLAANPQLGLVVEVLFARWVGGRCGGR